MGKYKKQSRVIYKCDYHIVWVPKYRFRILKGAVKDFVEEDVRRYCDWKCCMVEGLSVREDHVHLLVSVPPKVSISQLMGVLKGKTAIHLFKSCPNLKKKPYWGSHFWARGYFVSTVGPDEGMVRRNVQHQEKEGRKAEDQQQRFDF